VAWLVERRASLVIRGESRFVRVKLSMKLKIGGGHLDVFGKVWIDFNGCRQIGGRSWIWGISSAIEWAGELSTRVGWSA